MTEVFLLAWRSSLTLLSSSLCERMLWMENLRRLELRLGWRPVYIGGFF